MRRVVFVLAATLALSFSAFAQTVLTTISWTVSGTPPISLVLNPGNINVTGLTSKLVTVTRTSVVQHITFTLTATNLYGTTSRNVTITVNPLVVFTPTVRRHSSIL